MEITESFALAIRPTRVYLSSKNKSMDLAPVKSEFRLRVREPDATSVEFTLLTEHDAWEAVLRESPWAYEALQDSIMVADRGLALRCNLMLSHSASDFNLLEAKFAETLLRIFDTVLTALDAVVLTKSPRVPLRPCKSRTASYWSVGAKVQVPYVSQAFQMAVICFPSPIEEGAWSVHLEMPSFTNEIIKESQARMKTAICLLADHGIKVDDVLNGTYISP